MNSLRRSPEQILLPQGFSFSAVAAGIKVSGRPDLALAEVEMWGRAPSQAGPERSRRVRAERSSAVAASATAAALFTKNLVVAAPLEVGRAALRSTGGRVRALLVNSGNANCATGRAGIQACERVCRDAGKLLGVPATEIFPSSTGIIGIRLPAEKILEKLPELVAARSPSRRGVLAFAHAIMTTDTRPKIASARFPTKSKDVTVLGIAKGAGMIHPQLATMLVYLFTDVGASSRELQPLLCEACDQSLNCMSIDGDTSTNDTVLLLASGASGVRANDAGVGKKLSVALTAVCQSLTEQIVSDGEGAQHVIRLLVEQSSSREEALIVARTIAHSMLVKTAWAGADPNWGRILAAVGRCGLPIDPSRVQIFVGRQKVCRNGIACAFNEKQAHRDLAKPVCDIRVQLGRGWNLVRFLTTDLTAEYVRINADYST
jgi:glutamate N-acetyltransferase / amino-acid N-acetyltransferase